MCVWCMCQLCWVMSPDSHKWPKLVGFWLLYDGALLSLLGAVLLHQGEELAVERDGHGPLAHLSLFLSFLFSQRIFFLRAGEPQAHLLFPFHRHGVVLLLALEVERGPVHGVDAEALPRAVRVTVLHRSKDDLLHRQVVGVERPRAVVVDDAVGGEVLVQLLQLALVALSQHTRREGN